MPDNDYEQELSTLLVQLDEAIILKAIEKADAQRTNRITDALVQNGVNVPIRTTEKPFYKSKKFWGGAIALLILVCDRIFKLDIWVVAAAPLAYVFGQGLADLGKNKV